MRSFDLVDLKTAEAEYFLSQIGSLKFDLYEIQFLFSAYLSAARSITFTLQAVLKDLEEFKVWYFQKQQALKQDSQARFFLEARNLAQKVGIIPIIGGAGYQDESGKSHAKFFFDPSSELKSVPEDDVYTATRRNFCTLLEIILECYFEFGTSIDPHQHYTKVNFDYLEKTIDDVDEELLGIRGYTDIEDWPEAYRWQAHRRRLSGCKIDHLFTRYLGKSKPYPPILPEEPSDFNGEYWTPPCLKKISGN